MIRLQSWKSGPDSAASCLRMPDMHVKTCPHSSTVSLAVVTPVDQLLQLGHALLKTLPFVARDPWGPVQLEPLSLPPLPRWPRAVPGLLPDDPASTTTRILADREGPQ